MLYRIKKREKIELQYLIVLQHWNITHTSMITVKCKKSSQMMMFRKFTSTGISIVYRKTDDLELPGFFSIVCKSMISNVSLLITWPIWPTFSISRRGPFQTCLYKLSKWYWGSLFNSMEIILLNRIS